jgi:uncharacterized LabA/DUF88 family protein
MDRLVGFIDFGFLKAGAAKQLKTPTRDLRPEPEAVVAWLQSLGHDFLRGYWYDGAYDSRHAKHRRQRSYFERIAKAPGIQLRLGHLQETTPTWQYPVQAALKKCGVELSEFEKHFRFKPQLSQKGVDTRITLDMVRLAQRHAYDVGILIGGDRDLAEPLRLAQDEGRRMLVAVPKGAGIAAELKQLADEVIVLDKSDVELMFKIEGPADG